MASASTSTAVNTPTDSCYQIFLNHRGPDTKNTFTSHLYRRLVLHGFRVFWDKEEMQVGDTLTRQIHDAIKAASLHVAVFSPRYAESTWCLQELLLMLESKKPIIPVFYGVQPTDLRRTEGEGVYAEALRNLEKKRAYDSQPPYNPATIQNWRNALSTHWRNWIKALSRAYDAQPRYNPTTIENWRKALSTVAGISGLELDRFNGDEGELVDKVVESVLQNLGRTCLDVAEHPTGLDKKIEDFENKVLSGRREQSGKPQVIGIVGFGGIGKTTLVKEFFNRKSSQYRNSCFLFDVRETARRDSLKSLQEILLNDLTLTNEKIRSVSEGIDLLKTRLSSCEALVILDDVDHISQLDALLRPIRDNLHPRSLIVITSRDKGLLRKSKVEESSIYKLTGLDTQHSQELFCLHAFSQGHPLTGFEDLVHRYLKACDGLPLSLKVFGALLYENDIYFWQDQLDRLEEILPEDIEKSLQISYDALQRDEKEIFLDIACFFIGENRDTAIRIWDGSGWRGSLGFRSLQNKNLVEMDTANNIRMHDHLRDLGRNLAKSPELPRRIWRTEDFEDLLQQSCDTDVRGISICGTKIEEQSFSRCKIKNLQLLDTFAGNYDYHDTRGSGERALERIQYALQSPNLIWFRWHSHQHSSPPSWIPMKKLRVLELRGRNLETLWPESQAPLQLRQLTVRRSAITSLPQSLENLTNLEHIQLSSSHSYSLTDSLGTLTRLRYLDLRYFSKLTSKTLGTMCTLEHLSLSLCESIEVLPSNIGELKNLKYLNLDHCVGLESLPDSLGQLNQLTELRISSCWRLREVPFKMVEGERESINCPNLQHLRICSCDELVEVGTLPVALTTLELILCDQLRKIEWSSPLSKLRVLKVKGCKRLEQLPSLETLVSLEELHAFACDQLRKIEWSSPLSKLRVLKVKGCHRLEQLPSLETLVSLEELDTSGCRELRSIRGLAHLPKLRTIRVCGCTDLEELEGVEDLTSLKRSDFEGLEDLEYLALEYEKFLKPLKT